MENKEWYVNEQDDGSYQIRQDWGATVREVMKFSGTKADCEAWVVKHSAEILRELETDCVKITLLQDKAGAFYVREIGMTAKNEHDCLQKFNKQSEANVEVNRLAELLRDNGARIICDTWYTGKRKPISK